MIADPQWSVWDGTYSKECDGCIDVDEDAEDPLDRNVRVLNEDNLVRRRLLRAAIDIALLVVLLMISSYKY